MARCPGSPGWEGPGTPAPVCHRSWPPTSPRAEKAAGGAITEAPSARPLRPRTAGGAETVYGPPGRRGLADGDEGGALAGLGRRTESPPPPPARRVNKAATRASHLPGAATPRPLSPGGPDRVGRGQGDRTQARRRRRRQANAGQGPRCFLWQSRLRRSGSARGRLRHFRPGVGPRSQGSRRALGHSALFAGASL